MPDEPRRLDWTIIDAFMKDGTLSHSPLSEKEATTGSSLPDFPIHQTFVQLLIPSEMFRSTYYFLFFFYYLLAPFNSYYLTSSLFPNKSYLLIRARCVAGLLKHGKVSRKHSNSYEIGALSPNTRY